MQISTDKRAMEVTTLAGGCFWCLEAVYLEIRGVEKVVSGYSGGTAVNPSYEQVCMGQTGHAEAVQITFDPSEISFKDILMLFFSSHDPTTRNRQGADVGTQYRSAIFCHTEDQQQRARKVIQDIEASGAWAHPIVTEVEPLSVFYPAEAYHQNYFAQNPDQPYCQIVIRPKVSDLKTKHRDRVKQRV